MIKLEEDPELQILIKTKPRLQHITNNLQLVGYDLWHAKDIAIRRRTMLSTASQNARNMRKRGIVFGIEIDDNCWRYPNFQFDSDNSNPKKIINNVLDVIPRHIGGLTLLNWFLTPLTFLYQDIQTDHYNTPLEMLDHNNDLLVKLAEIQFLDNAITL